MDQTQFLKKTFPDVHFQIFFNSEMMQLQMGPLQM